MNAVLTPRARREVLAAAAWIMQDSPNAARAFRTAVAEALALLGEQPLVGTERPELADPPIRFWMLGRFPYLAVYDADRRPPAILRIVHGARDMPDVLGEMSGQ